MNSFVLDVPRMYGDHHVVEVRRILLAIAGVAGVDASSAFRVVEIEFDAERTSEAELKEALSRVGYLGDLEVPTESGDPTIESTNGDRYFRHSATYEAARNVISFGQQVSSPGRPLWPCPGIDRTPAMDE